MVEPSSSGEKNREEEEYEEASLSSPITAASKTIEKKRRYFSERGYLNTLSQQERRRIEQEIREGHKAGEIGCLI